MNTYSSYKDSGIEWIGEIPSEWNIVKTKYMTSPRKELSDSGKEELLSVSEYLGVIPRSVIRKGKGSLSRSESLIGYLKVYKGDLVNNIMLMWKKGLGVSQYDGIVSPAYSVFNFIESVPSYYHYLYRTDRYITEFRKNSTGVIMSRLRLYDDDFGDIPSVIPSLQEQQQISDYLDYKTSKMDKLLEKTQQKIELLKEQRISLINTTVTKGLNPNVEMKDSGIEWIGEIPSGWNVTKLKYTCNITYGISPPDTTYNDKGRGEILINGPVEYSKEDFGYTRSTKWTTDPKKFTEKGSLLFCLRGSTGRMNITHDYVSIGRGVCSIISKESQWFMIYSMFIVRDYIQGEITGSTFPSVTKDDVDNYFICTPPQQEQQQIVDYLDKETTKIDKLIDTETKRINLLKEYRQSLVSDIVTGKVDVRDEVLV